MRLSDFRPVFVLMMCLWLSACVTNPDTLEPPNVTLANIAPAGDMTLFEQRYDVTLRVQNPNDAVLPVKGISYAISLNEQEFARGVSDDAVRIPALGEELVKVTVASSPLDWLRQIGQLQNNPAFSPSYSVQGKLYLQGYGDKVLPFSQAGKFMP